MSTAFEIEKRDCPELNNIDIAEILRLSDRRRLFEIAYAEIDVALNYLIEFYPEIVDDEGSILHTMANNGIAEIYVLLGDAYKKGLCVEHDVNKALYYYTKAAQRGNCLGTEYSAALYLDRKHFGIDYDKAYQLLNNATSINGGSCKSSFGNYALGNMYLLGAGTDKNVAKAKSYYSDAENASLSNDYAPQEEDPYYWKALYRQAQLAEEYSGDNPAYLEWIMRKKKEAVRIWKNKSSTITIEEALLNYD